MTSTPIRSVGKTILIADPDHVSVRWLGPRLRDRGFQVHAASDGSQALQTTLLRHPDLILFDRSCSLIEAEAFLRILRSNPRTEAIPVVITGEKEVGPPAAAQASLRKPYVEDELYAKIEQVIRRSRPSLPLQESELRGQLTQLPMPDLLQVLSMNRRTGRLLIRSGGLVGEIDVVEGQVHDARWAGVVGEKALFRILAQKKGSFELVVSTGEVPNRLGRSLDRLLLDGSYQADELSRLMERLPAPMARVELLTEPPEPAGLSAPVAQVVDFLRTGPGTVAGIIERVVAPDLDAAQALEEVLQQGWARVAGSVTFPVDRPLLDPSDLHLLRQRLLRARRSAVGPAVGKILLAPGSAAEIHDLAPRLASLPGHRRADATREIGTFAHLELGEEVVLDLISFPSDDSFRPLWPLLAAGALGALILDEGPAGAGLEAWLERVAQLPVVRAAADPVDQLRSLLVSPMERSPGQV